MNLIPKKRRKSREIAIQTLYAYNILKNKNFKETMKYCIEQHEENLIDLNYYHEIIHGTIKNLSFLNIHIKLHISRSFKKLGIIEKSILQLSFYEFLIRKDIPYKVIINESIELAKIFGSSKSHKFINGVLDQFVKKNIKK